LPPVSNPTSTSTSTSTRSKTIGEQTAWDFVKSPEAKGMQLVVMNPGVVVGPALSAHLHERCVLLLGLLLLLLLFLLLLLLLLLWLLLSHTYYVRTRRVCVSV
jgi:hypothetical protein